MARPELTELQRVKLENFAMKHQLLQQQMGANMNERSDHIRSLEAEHPGWKWEESVGLVPGPGIHSDGDEDEKEDARIHTVTK